MTSDSNDRCTLVICHSEKIKSTLFEIMERMKCEICEISSIGDLLEYVQDSNLDFLQFSETPDEDPFLFPKDHHIIHKKDENIPASHTSKKIPSQEKAGSKKDLLYKSNHMTLGEIEKLYIVKTLSICGWKCKTAAQLLGINRTTLYRKMKKYGIVRDK